MEIKTKIILGDCLNKLKELEDNSIDLIFTSPPYADQRANTYGGVAPDKYVEWFLPILMTHQDSTVLALSHSRLPLPSSMF
jgi:DNA modification methylase